MKSRQHANFFNEEMLRAPGWRLWRSLFTGLVVLLLVVGGVNIYLLLDQNALQQNKLKIEAGLVQLEQQTNNVIQQLEQRKSRQQKALKKLKQLQQTQQKLQKRLQKKSAPSGVAGHSFSSMLEALAYAHQEGLYLTEFQFLKGGEQVSLKGNALNPQLIPQYMDRLTLERRSGFDYELAALRSSLQEEEMFPFSAQLRERAGER